jgi:hypothetical protein
MEEDCFRETELPRNRRFPFLSKSIASHSDNSQAVALVLLGGEDLRGMLDPGKVGISW